MGAAVISVAHAQPEFMFDFRNPAHRAQMLEDGLEFVATYPPGNNPRWALYRVTSATPRIYFPGAVVPVDTNDYYHGIRICTAGGYYTEESGQPGTGNAIIELRGNKVEYGQTQSIDSEFGKYVASATPWGTCQADGDKGGGFGTMEPVDGIYVQVVPFGTNTEIPIDSVIPLRMVAIGNGLNTGNHAWPPQICCENELDCDVHPYCGDGIRDPWEVCDDGNNVDGDGCEADCMSLGEPPDPTDPPDGGDGGEPPDPTDPPDGGSDGGTEPPDPTDPSDGGTEPPNPSGNPDGGVGEPPGTSNPPGTSEPAGVSVNGANDVPACQVSFGTPVSGSPLAALFALVGVVALRRRHHQA